MKNLTLHATFFFFLGCMASHDLIAQSPPTAFSYQFNAITYINLIKLNTLNTRMVLSRGGNLYGSEISCYGPNDTLLWAKRVGDNSAYFGVSSMTAGTNGTFFISARNINAGGDRLCKMDSAGNVIWMRSAPFSTECNMTCLPGSGNLLIAGSSRLCVYDSLGSIISDKEMPGIVDSEDMVMRDSTSVLCVGAAYNSTGGVHDIYIMALSDTGGIIWARNYTGRYMDGAKSIARCSDGNFVVTGYTTSFGQAGSDIVVMKIDGNGQQIWTKVYSSSGNEGGRDVEVVANGNIVIAGYSNSGSGVERRLLMLLDSSGNMIRATAYTEASFPSNCQLYEIIVDSTNIYTIGEGTSRAYFQKSGMSLNTGCLTSSIDLTVHDYWFQPNTSILRRVWYATVNAPVVLPESVFTPTFTINCQSTCEQNVNFVISDTELCAGDSLIAIIDNLIFDSTRFFVDNVYHSSNDSITLALSAGFHHLKAIKYNVGCIDSSTWTLQVDTVPSMIFTHSERELFLNGVNSSSNVEFTYWMIDQNFQSYDDSIIYMFEGFGAHLLCVVGGNSCATDTICTLVTLHDSIQAAYYHELHTTESPDWNGGSTIAAMHDGGAVFCGGVNDGALVIMYLRRMNADGSLRWHRFYNYSTSPAYLSTNAAIETEDNGTLIAGNTGYGQSAMGIVLRFDSSGNYLWQIAITGACIFYDIIATADSGFVAIGERGGDVIAIKVNWFGQVVWYRSYDGYSDAKAIISDGDGGFVITGKTFSVDMYIMKIDGDGNWIWDQQFGSSSGGDYGTDLIRAEDNGLYVYCYTASYQSGYSDLVLVKTDSIGQYQWAKRYWQVGRNQTPEDLFLKHNGNLLLYGKGQGDVTFSIEPPFAMEVDSVGEIVWSRTLEYPGYSSGVFYGVGELEMGNNDRFYVTNYTTNYDKTIYGQMGADAFTGCNGTGVYSVQAQSINFNSAMQYSPVQTSLNYSMLFYSVNNYSLLASDVVGCYSTACNPTIGFTYTTNGDSLFLVGTSSHNAQWNWYFGDGDSSSQQSPSHLYAFDGTYFVCAVVTTSCTTDTICQWISVLTTFVPSDSVPNQFSIAPNPSENEFVINGISGTMTLEILDPTGRIVKEVVVENGDRVNVSSLPSGLYFLRVSGSGTSSLARTWIKTSQ